MWFWKQSKTYVLAPGDIVEQICEGKELEGLYELDFVKIQERIQKEFPEFEKNMFDAGTHYFTIDIYLPFAFQIVSTPPTNHDVIHMLNRIIDIAKEFECPLYDPQSNVRYAINEM